MANEGKNISEKPKIDDGGPAFPGTLGVPGYGAIPVNLPNGQTGWVDVLPGMTLRDYFAAKAMSAIITSIGAEPAVAYAEPGQTLEAVLAYKAYIVADAMLKARAQ